MLWNARNGAVALEDTELSYVSFGRGEKVLILLPGLSDGLATVRGKAMLLAGTYRCFFDRYTVYMFSRRDKLPAGHTIRDMARDQAAAMDALGIGSACVMGVSQGGMIAQYLAIDCPERVEKLVLTVTAPYANGTARDCIARWIDLARRGDYGELAADMNARSYTEKYLKKYERITPFIGAMIKRANLDRFFVNAEAILAFDARDELGRIACPTFIVGGTADRVVGTEAAHELHAAIAGSELYLYEGLGHGAYEEAKDFNRRVFDWLEGKR